VFSSLFFFKNRDICKLMWKKCGTTREAADDKYNTAQKICALDAG